MTTPAAPLGAARSALAGFVQDHMAKDDELILDALLDEALDRFVGAPDFQRTSAEEVIRFLLPQIVQERRTENRAAMVAAARHGRETFRAAVEKKKLEVWFESLGPGRSKTGLDMTRPELAFALREHDSRIAGMMRWQNVRRELHDRLPNDHVTIREFFPEPDLEEIFLRHLGGETA